MYVLLTNKPLELTRAQQVLPGRVVRHLVHTRLLTDRQIDWLCLTRQGFQVLL